MEHGRERVHAARHGAEERRMSAATVDAPKDATTLKKTNASDMYVFQHPEYPVPGATYPLFEYVDPWTASGWGQ